MWLLFVLLPLAGLLAVDVGAFLWWARRNQLLNSGVPATGEVVRINITVTRHVDTNTQLGTSSTTIRPVVRFTTQTGELITASPMRSAVDKLLIPGDPVKIRYSAGNPMRCVVDQRGAKQGTVPMLAGLAFLNIFLIGFASIGGRIAEGWQSDDQSATPPSIAQGLAQGLGQATGETGLGQSAGSGTGSRTTTPTPSPAATTTGAWSAADGPLTVTVVKVVNAGGNVSLTVSAHDGAAAAVTLPIYSNFTATDSQGTAYTAHPLAPIAVPAGGTVSDTLTLDQTVPTSARSLKLAWTHVFSQDPALNGSITVTGVPLPHHSG
ncbi:DUF3592 domain-containing protein [Streptomyces sp. NPDC059467]|uniref:DUF3592 domain-containing protein n=1 Tax=Streptomyces sp. NPDC059467 TaxID=3346844 RepID=UPI0036A9D83F